MSEKIAPKRLSKVAKEFNIATTTIVEFLSSKGVEVDTNPNTKISPEMYVLLQEKFQSDKLVKEYANEKAAEDKRLFEESEKESESKPEVVEPEVVPEETNEVLIKSNIKHREEEENVKEEQVVEKIEESKKDTEEIKVEEKEEDKKETKEKTKDSGLKVLGKIDLTPKKPKEKAQEKPKEEAPEKPKEEAKKPVKEEAEKEEKKPKKEETRKEEKEEKIEVKAEEKQPEKPKGKEKVQKKESAEKEDEIGLTIVGKIDVKQFEKKKKVKEKAPVASTSDPNSIKKKRRRIVKKDSDTKDKKKFQAGKGGKGKRQGKKKVEVDDKVIKEQVSATLAKLTGKQQSNPTRAKIKKQKRKESRQKEMLEANQEATNTIEVIEFITVNELANLMEVNVTDVITTCMNMGMMVNINQRLDAETITFVADEFNYEVIFTQESIEEEELSEAQHEDRLVPRAPVVTIMGHVDHGKTSLLDFIRSSKITAGEAGGITQHIGAYKVKLEDGKEITFLDTPGHEAFTSMRARGAKVTDIVIIVVAADDSVMPQTKEAISHAQAAGVPLVFAINKMDKDGANPDRIKEQLSEMNILVEDWGGKYQCQEISAKKGTNVDDLLEKVLLEAEMLELKADPEIRAVGAVIEATLDKGKGITTTVLIQDGTLRVGDPILAGAFYGRVKAMTNEHGKKIDQAGPATPVEVLGFDGAPTAGDAFYVTDSESTAKEVATKRKRLLREQGIRATKHVTLDEIGRRIALGNFKELNVIIKGDVDGSVEALSDSLQKLSTPEVQININHKGVGQISESDVLLATASDAIIIGFQVRPSLSARKMAEKEEIDIRTYSVIYDAIEELKAALEGLLEPTEVEKITCNIEVRDVFKITKVGAIAGCMVVDGKINRNTKVRVLREGVVIYTGELSSLKRFKDDVKEVLSGYECGIGIKNFNDIKVGDIIEGFTIEKVKRTL